MSLSSSVFRASDLLSLAARLLGQAGLAPERARVVAEVLVEADLLGHTTHGLDMLPLYLRDLEKGAMAREGDPLTRSDTGSAIQWDGGYLPGPWLVHQAIALARQRLPQHPVVTLVIRRSHHIGCLQAYLEGVARDGLVLLLTCSDPSGGGVTPHGGVAPRLTPNPLAAGFPTDRGPVLIDVSLSTTTNALTRRLAQEGGRLPGEWLVDSAGQPSADPTVLLTDPPGAMLPLGGLDLGHKGFALALLVEALTSGLAGHGRADGVSAWGASVFLQLIDPAGFAGRDAFRRETTALRDLCESTPVPPGRPPVRLPGDGALRRKAQQLAQGVELHPRVMPALAPWAARAALSLPDPLPRPPA